MQVASCFSCPSLIQRGLDAFWWGPIFGFYDQGHWLWADTISPAFTPLCWFICAWFWAREIVSFKFRCIVYRVQKCENMLTMSTYACHTGAPFTKDMAILVKYCCHCRHWMRCLTFFHGSIALPLKSQFFLIHRYKKHWSKIYPLKKNAYPRYKYLIGFST